MQWVKVLSRRLRGLLSAPGNVKKARRRSEKIGLEELEERIVPHFYFNGQLYADDAVTQFTAATWATGAGSSSPASSPQTAGPAVLSADPAVVGQWGADVAWPVEAIEAALLPTGKVLAYDRGGVSTLWDPATGLQSSVPAPPFNIFCTGLTHLPDGDLLLTGGHIHNDMGLAYS